MIKMGSFRSYIGLDEYELKVPPPIGETLLQPNFLGGELVIAEAHNVLKFTSLSKKNGVSGSLFVTNCRLVFVSSDHVCQEVSVPLLSIHTLCHYDDEKRKIRHRIKLTPSGSQTALFSSQSTRIHEIFVICSNFRTLNISFKFSPIDHGKKICNAILHYAIPDSLERLFYFDYCKKTPPINSDGGYNNRYASTYVPYLDVALDWHKELKITRAPAYRVSDINEAFRQCETLPEWIVVPASIVDAKLKTLAEKLKGSRPPFWVWGDQRGGAIIRMGKLHNEADSSSENAFFELLRKSHKSMRPPKIVDLEGVLPIKEIKLSFNRFLELCCPESLQQYEESESRFLSALEHTKWLWWVSKTLQTAGDLAEHIFNQPDVVILQEHESRDLSCLISSVMQLILDPRFRTAIGFFSLIQKEWIAGGHAFHSGYLHTSPLFLLFLDVVFQLCNQNPFQFEFNDTLLHEIWDATFDSTIGTFLFDSPKQRKNLEVRRDLSVWHRILQKDDTESVTPTVISPTSTRAFVFPDVSRLRSALNSSFSSTSSSPSLVLPQLPQRLLNPMYKVRLLLHPPTRDSHPNQNNMLACSYPLCDIEMWGSLYLNRTSDAIPTIGLGPNNISSPVLLPGETHVSPNKSKAGSRNSSLSSSGSPFETTSFIQLPDRLAVKRGPDPAVEMKLVDLLLTMLTSTNRYHRNPQAISYNSGSNSRYRPGSGSPGRAVRAIQQQQHHQQQRINPFANGYESSSVNVTRL